MKHKKKIVTLLLASALLTASLTGCNTVQNGGDKIDTTTTTESTTSQVPETQPTYSNIYANELKQFKKLLTIKKNFENYDVVLNQQLSDREENEILNTLISATYDMAPTKAGYCIRDINGDGTDELILLDENYYIYALFTTVNGDTKVIDTFKGDTNHIGAIGADGTVYKSGYSKGENHYAEVQKISENGELTGLTFWCEDESVYVPDAPCELHYFKEVDGVRTSLDEESFNTLYLEYTFALHHPTEITKQSGIEFTSMNLENPTSFSNLESYKGTWYDSQNPPDELTISSVSNKKIECQLGVYRLGLYHLTAIQEDGKFVFTDENNLISGTMQFSNGSILVVIEQSNSEYCHNGQYWLFTIKSSDDPFDSGTTEDTEPLISADFASYDSIIATYRKIVETRLYYESINEEDYFIFPNEEAKALYQEIFSSTLTLFPSSSNGTVQERYNRFGYTVQDLNKDGIDELILRLDDHTVIAIFSMVGGKPILLGNFWNRHRCWIDTEGLLHISGSNSAWNSVWHIYRISDQTGNLILLEEGGTDGYDEASGTTLFYKLVNNEKVYVTEEEYTVWVEALTYDKFEVTENISTYLPFIPVFDENHPIPSPIFPDAKG